MPFIQENLYADMESSDKKPLPVFSFLRSPYGSSSLWVIKNNITGEAVSFFPAYGAMLYSLELHQLHSGRTLQILDTVKDFAELEHNPAYKGTVLFPFPNRIKDGKYEFHNTTYQLPINENELHHALHGFCYNKPFKVAEQRDSPFQAETELVYEEDGLTPGYPFKCALRLTYTLTVEGKFVCRATVKNLDDKAIPVAVGFHPYFKLSVDANELELKVPSHTVFEVDKRMIPVNTRENYDFIIQKKIGDYDMKNCYILDAVAGVATTEITDVNDNVTILLEQETGFRKFNYLQLYVPENRQSIAIEPQTCAADSFNNNIGLLELLPGDTFNASWSVSLR
jgi:aldose 1-epimerase